MRFSALFVSAVVANLIQCATTSSNFPIISTSFGAIRGFSLTAEDGTEAEIFKRISFALPPIGDLRWQKPQPPRPWNITLDSTFFGPECAQPELRNPISGVSEDCLYINVYTSRKCRQMNSCSVVFVVHGGNGVTGSPARVDDELLVRNFVSQDIVVVTTAYRLTVFGAIALGDENVLPSNLAMHDIIASLTFTRNEIGRFGGDKEKITLIGQSYGGLYVLMTAFSPGISKPGVKRPFKGVISMSGKTALADTEDAVQRSRTFAKGLGCEGSAREILLCLRGFDTKSIIAAVNPGPRGPNGIIPAGELFPIRNERELREEIDPIRLMTGTTIFELGGGDIIEVDVAMRAVGITNREECLEKYLNDIKSGKFPSQYNEISQEIVLTSHIFAKHVADIGGEPYLYEYDYEKHGIHTQDSDLLFGDHKYEKDENELWLSRAYPRYFANFINGKRPAEDWTPVNPQLMNYYSINRSLADNVFPEMRYGYQKDLTQYYDELVEYDKSISIAKIEAAKAPVQYKSQNKA